MAVLFATGSPSSIALETGRAASAAPASHRGRSRPLDLSRLRADDCARRYAGGAVDRRLTLSADAPMGGSHPRCSTVSPKELLVLELLRHQELYGLQLVAAIEGPAEAGHRLRHARSDGGEGLHHLDARRSALWDRWPAATHLRSDGARAPHVHGLDQWREATGAGVGPMRPPGTRLRAVAARLFAANTMDLPE